MVIDPYPSFDMDGEQFLPDHALEGFQHSLWPLPNSWTHPPVVAKEVWEVLLG